MFRKPSITQGALGALLALIFTCTAQAGGSGLVRMKSHYNFEQTIGRFQDAVRAAGMTVFARIDHHKGAASAGLEMKPVSVLIFGNPKVGTQLMQSAPSAGIDLPMKVVVIEQAPGEIELIYNDPAWLAQRHGIEDRKKLVKKMQQTLSSFAEAATGQ
ncbi:MAG TPA: DUF302 domain-containing protein [Gammaproteobacteria bacterium]|nr:DUF302 domain-containing protein [Gammaproteobacteria bacterium]